MYGTTTTAQENKKKMVEEHWISTHFNNLNTPEESIQTISSNSILSQETVLDFFDVTSNARQVIEHSS